MEWARILAYITGTVDQQLLLRDKDLAAENRILKAQLQRRLRLSDAKGVTLGEIGHRLGRKALGEVATAALPQTILGCYRRLVARKFDGSRARRARRPSFALVAQRIQGRPSAEDPSLYSSVDFRREFLYWASPRLMKRRITSVRLTPSARAIFSILSMTCLGIRIGTNGV
jgi:hypothetical protein